MTEPDFLLAESRFSERIDSLQNDVSRCYWDIRHPRAPAPAPFPAVMYAFATIDYFPSYWAGWNESSPGKSQTDRLTGFMEKYLLYPSKESQIAVNFWRHKLMHTAEPRILRNADNSEVYIWEIGTPLPSHMMLLPSNKPTTFKLQFDPFALVHDLRDGVFGPHGYSSDLRDSADLQDKYQHCHTEMESYRIKLKP